MVEVKMIYNYVKEGRKYHLDYQTTEMDDAIELLQKINGMIYDEGYRVLDVKIEEVGPV